MDYEKKYKKALERAKRLYEQGTITESLGYVFPELKESEDERRREMKRATTDYTGIAACHNDRCPSHKNCLRWQIGQRNPDIIAGNFAPKGKYSQRCGDWKKGGVL